MSKKKGPRKKKRDSSPLPPERAGILRKLLEDPARTDAADTLITLSDPALAAAFLENLPAGDPDLVPVLTAVREAFDEKAVQKAARRAVFRFGQKGISVHPGSKRERSALRPTSREEERPFAFLTPFDSLAVRGILLGIPRPPIGIDLGAALASDEDGIMQFAGGSFSKKKALGARDQFLGEFQHVVTTSLQHAVTVLERAHRARPDGPGSVDYLKMRPWILDRFPPLTAPPVYDDIPVSEVTKRPFTESMAARLLDHEIMADWMVDPQHVQSLAEKIREAGESRIYLTEDQRFQRIDEIKLEWLRGYFKGPIRDRIRNRLEETAYVLLRLEDEEYARLACVAALSLAEQESFLGGHPLLSMMTDKALHLFPDGDCERFTGQMEPEDTQGKSPGGIIIP